MESAEWEVEHTEAPPAPPAPPADGYGEIAYDLTVGGSSGSCGSSHAPEVEVAAQMRNLLTWLRDESFIALVAEWSWDVSMEFPRDGSLLTTMEHPLRYTEAHQEYRQLFEARAEQYLHHFGVELDNFLQMAVDYLSAETMDDDVFEGLVASESYSTFFIYMCSVRRRREWAERTLCSAMDEIDWSELMRQAIRRDLGDVTVGDDSDIECLE